MPLVDPERPVIRCLVGFYQENEHGVTFAIRREPVSLYQAAIAKQLGAIVLLDPQDEIDAATYERQHRWWRKWERDDA